MGYATIDDVQRRMPQFTLSPLSKPNIDASQVFLDDTIAQFEGAMENLGYVVPITGARSLSQVKEIVCQGTIAKILYARSSALGTDVAVQSADRAQKQYDTALKMLADPTSPVELSDAVRNDDEMLKQPGGAPEALLTDDDGDTIEPRATMEMKF